MKARRVVTGSTETEAQIHKLLGLVGSPTEGALLSAWDNDAYMLRVMTKGRNGTEDRYPGSLANDDTGGFFDIRDGHVFLTDKARRCIFGLESESSHE